MKVHQYSTCLQWTGNTGKGTTSYRDYERAFTISSQGKPLINGSSDPSFRGDPGRYNPEEMLVASLSSCHMLWFLHFCSEASVIVIDYADDASGTLTETENGNGAFKEVLLQPRVTVKESWMTEKLPSLHDRAHEFCFIANSCNFPIRHQATANVAE